MAQTMLLSNLCIYRKKYGGELSRSANTELESGVAGQTRARDRPYASNMKMLLRTLALAVGAIILIPAAFLIVAPNLNWSAASKPGFLETELGPYIIGKWVRTNAPPRSNPFPANPETLRMGRDDFNEHCASCHGLDGNGRNRFEGDFYPRVPALTDQVQKLTDGEIYFIIAQGIRFSAMPAFSSHHEPGEIWRMIIWVRHLANLSPQEKAQMEADVKAQASEHEREMHGTAPPEAGRN